MNTVSDPVQLLPQRSHNWRDSQSDVSGRSASNGPLHLRQYSLVLAVPDLGGAVLLVAFVGAGRPGWVRCNGTYDSPQYVHSHQDQISAGIYLGSIDNVTYVYI